MNLMNCSALAYSWLSAYCKGTTTGLKSTSQYILETMGKKFDICTFDEHIVYWIRLVGPKQLFSYDNLTIYLYWSLTLKLNYYKQNE